jgi:hypothetical protein|tara:strand:+ start:163 stop:894 length:732 start_codon:yes stop_codon:yes gene_type:complete
MAINVNTVYQTVLMILNKEQRGFMTPEEFNKTATQVQLEVFEKYFDDLNQQLRIPQADTDYADRQENIDEKIAIFKTLGTALYDNTTLIDNPYFDLPSVDMYAEVVSFYRLGNVVHNDETIVQRLDRHDFYYVNKSKLTRPTVINPVYLYENNKIFIKPNSINSGIKIDYVRKPKDVVWAYGTGTLGQYEFQKDDSTNFELQESEQSDVILKILVYAGIIIRDPQIVQTAAALVQADETNKKS